MPVMRVRRRPGETRLVIPTVHGYYPPEMGEIPFRSACREDELPVGRCRVADVSGRKIVVYHIEEGFFATDNACPHRGGPLGEGDLIGREIVCPWHLWSFDVISGLNPGSPDGSEISVRTHEVRVEGGEVLVRIDDREPETA